MQNMSEHVYYSEALRILYILHDSTHITQTTVGNTLVTEQPQHSSMFASSRITQISVNGLIYNDLHGNQCNNFHIPNFLDFLRNSNVRKRPITTKIDPLTLSGYFESATKIQYFSLNSLLFAKNILKKISELRKSIKFTA